MNKIKHRDKKWSVCVTQTYLFIYD